MRPQRSLRFWTLYDAMEVAIIIAATAIVLIGGAVIATAQDAPLDLSILARLDAPTAAPVEVGNTLNLSILDRLDTPAATARTSTADTLDLTLLESLDSKPAIKPSKAALRSLGTASGVDLGDEIGREACKPQASIEIDYPTRASNWTYPGVGRSALIQHLTTAPQHRGKFQLDTLARLETNELQALHSDDHEGRKKPVTIAEAPRRSAATTGPNGTDAAGEEPRPVGKTPTVVAQSPPSWGNVTSFQWLDGVYRSTPQPGASYPTLGGVLVPLGGGAVSAPQVTRQQVYVRGNCPGGFCPVQ